jgi:hypothetical protein
MSAESKQMSPERILSTISGRVSGLAMGLWLAAIAIGVAGVVTSIDAEPQRMWQAVWVNFLYWTAIAQAGVVFGAVLIAAGGHWGKPFRRVAEPTGAFLPFSLLIFGAMYFGADHIFPWMHPPVEGHVNFDWLTHDGVWLRNGALLAGLYLMSFYFMRVSLRPDARLIAGKQTGWRHRVMNGLTRGWRGDEEEAAHARKIMSWLGPALVGAWVLVFSFVSFDLAMSLMPGFISVIWGPLYFLAGWLCLLSLVAILAHRYKERHNLEDAWGKWDFHDLGKLMFAFTIFWAYIWFSQYLPIWYGNMGRETVFFELRTVNGFGPLLWAQMALVFMIPFALLLWRRPKMDSRYLSGVAMVLLVGFWLERYNLVVPSVWRGEGPPFGWPEIAITVGFAGLFGLCYSVYASLTPKLPIYESLMSGKKSFGP